MQPRPSHLRPNRRRVPAFPSLALVPESRGHAPPPRMATVSCPSIHLGFVPRNCKGRTLQLHTSLPNRRFRRPRLAIRSVGRLERTEYPPPWALARLAASHGKLLEDRSQSDGVHDLEPQSLSRQRPR